MKIGIVGLPNIGKSTLFNALTKKQVEASNYPFCTIDPNIGVVKVPDERLEKLAKIYHSAKTIYSTIEFVDIAGLVKNAHKGEGLGNQFLSHIREVDAIAHVIRNFHDDNVIHVEGKIDPQNDLSTIETELAMADLATVEKVLAKLKDKAKTNNKEAGKAMEIINPILDKLAQGEKPDISKLSPDEYKLIKNLNLLSLKPELFIENIDEKNIQTFKPIIPCSIPICAQLEAEIGELGDDEIKKYLQELNIEKSGLDRLISAGYELLNLITFFTAGPKESHAWPIIAGTKAPQAAGEIHTDFEKGFIRAEIINWQNIVDCQSDVKAKEKGLMRLEGKEYIMRDGDVALFHFNK
ncbi:redox-regulated ATPase YchF [Candidatus Kuenenbacteria bacterium CG11_big_fil_rev_8_21_14_0_20_37_9]|uniref:Ribosome-binding ATPase YchF n=2 Tax=Candidatus Kueneniibacteriota TaxID=1752740 RepID=A0A2M6XT03_9BACT|nr:MAG: redox-regulated ATPase YchF [Candidatus Kuenenbacteria bacterium CG1_02_38_13]PIR05876.1 MAG: redox-regulated ATPase YchF [Candidatus Kuenenbacteria bacterium CG11_big_fil_rev_8_21_14_0_20_37_9]PIU10775.1 MAG: redox-regulated ATPase YchF [Candidatus Kuenenbacteria bacterium CG08_land_8_20_14_0_20_37_23]